MDRIIIIARNDEFPKIGRIMGGVGVDGTAVMGTVRLRANEEVCKYCCGSGEVAYWDGNPSHRDTYGECETCEGKGIISHEIEELEE